ncbi:MAG: hypothetical protein KA397_01100 [Paludibacteraceae bacterium]|jgi:hypothetical protein|nr:hypothetical protein [Paludibacteraceae bacterium]
MKRRKIQLSMKRKLLSALLLLLFGFSGFAQSNLEIRHAFDKYGNQKGSVMVELKGEMLQGYDFDLFRSLTIRNNSEAAHYIRKCLALDESGARKVKEIVANGLPTSIYLQLPPLKGLHRLILFNEVKHPSNEITLIYIESKLESEDILKLILKRNK